MGAFEDNNMKLETKRLVIRNPKLSDAKDITKNINNLNISKWLLVVPYPYKLKDAVSWIKGLKKKTKDEIRFVIELKENKEVIGGMGIHHINKFQGKCDIGYWLGEKYWRQGYGSEALNEILKLIFNKLKLRRVEVEVFAKNPSSGKLFSKFGAQKEGYKRKAVKCKADGKIKDAIMYGLLKEDWKSF